MRLQTILFPKKNDCTIELYLRKTNSEISFDTYFNMFSLKKWKKYTILDNVYLELILVGKCQVKLFADDTCVCDKVVDTKQEKTIRFQYPDDVVAQMIWFKIVKMDINFQILSGYYATFVAEESLRHVRLGVDICTFRREIFVKRNVERLRRELLDNSDIGLQDCLEIFVVDNGRTLGKELEKSNNIHVIENRNVGGSGGFTRGLIEILSRKEDKQFTHVIFMDDDADIEPDSIIRVYALLRLIRAEFENIKIGGTMLRQDVPYMEYASGELWNSGRLLNPRFGIDLRKKSACMENEEELICEYAGWWFCCMPLTIANESNLPFPMFIHLDDVEYGLRNCENGFLYLNGICVWHPYFEHRRPSCYEYYEVRNGAMIRLLHSGGNCLRDIKSSLFRRITANILRYRYDDVELNFKAIEDLCKGIVWLSEQDAEVYHSKIASQGYVFKPIDELLDDSIEVQSVLQQIKSQSEIESQKRLEIGQSRKKLFTYNGWLVPAKKICIQAFPMGTNPYEFFRIKKLFLYDPANSKGILGQRSLKELIKAYKYYYKAVKLLNIYYPTLEREYRDNGRYLMSIKFWKKYLKLDGE